MAYRVKEVVLRNWKQFESALSQLEALVSSGNPFPYDRVVIDRVDVLFGFAMAQACDDLNVKHPTDAGYGKGWDALKRLFSDGVDRFLALPCGRWFLCHSSWKEVETREGDKIEKLVPVLSGIAEGVVNGKVDIWAAYDYVGSKRVIIVRGDERTGAGNRLDEEGAARFVTTKGEKIVEIDAGGSPAEAYQNLIKAFENKQTYARISTPPPTKEERAALAAPLKVGLGKGKGKGQ
jgi:hypothetical protein